MESVAVASIAQDDLSLFPACTVTTMHFRHRQTDRQTDGH